MYVFRGLQSVDRNEAVRRISRCSHIQYRDAIVVVWVWKDILLASQVDSNAAKYSPPSLLPMLARRVETEEVTYGPPSLTKSTLKALSAK
jgi:hypothetical protein